MSRRRSSAGDVGATTPTGGAGGSGATAGGTGPARDDREAGPGAGGAATGAASGAAPGGIVDQAKQTTGQVVGQVKEQAATRLDRQKEAAAAGLSSVADAVRQAGQNLRVQGEGQSPVARYAAQYGDKAAEQIERLTEYLRRNDAGQLVREVEGFARRQPALFLGGAFLLGLAGARFLKSSNPAADLPYPAPDASRALPPAGGTSAGGAGTGPTAGAGVPGSAAARGSQTASAAAAGGSPSAPGTASTTPAEIG